MDIRTYLRIIGRYWLLIVLVMAVSGAAAVALVNVRTPVFRAAARVVVQPAAVISDTRTIVDLVGQMGDRRVAGTFAQAFTSEDVRTEAQVVAGISNQEAVDYEVAANVLPDTHVIEVSGMGPDPQKLATLLNSTVSAMVQRAPQIFRVLELQALEPARPPLVPSAPVPTRDIPLGIGLGLILGVMLALATDYLRGPRGVGGRIRALPTPDQLGARKVGGR